jgi:hypothetical protein
VTGAADVLAAVEAFQDYVTGETLAKKLVLGTLSDAADVRKDVDIDGRRVSIALRRHDGRKGETR